MTTSAMTDSAQDAINAVVDIFRRQDGKQHLFTTDTLQTAILSLSAFYKAATHPYVIDKTKKCAKPIFALVLLTFFLSTLLLVPIRAIALAVQVVTLGFVSSDAASGFGQRWVSDAVAYAPMASMLIVRSFVRKPLYKCFIHMLREVNPQTAKLIESTPRIANPNRKSKSDKMNEKVDKTYQRAVNMLTLSAGLYICRQVPFFGRLVAPVMHYVTMNKSLGPRRAAVMSLVALYSPVEPFVIKFVEVWRASKILAPEILDPYLSHTVSYQDRAAFFRNHEVTISAFLAPQVLLLSVPVVGPLIFVPMQGASAWLVDLLARQSATQQQDQPISGQGNRSNPAAAQYASKGAPTVPAASYPGQGTYQAGQGNYQYGHSTQQAGQGSYQSGPGSYQQSAYPAKYS